MLRISFIILFASIALMNPVCAETVTIPETKVTFEPPAEFKPLPQNIIDIKWPSQNAPKYAVGNETTETTIAYDVNDGNVTHTQLPALQEQFVEVFEKAIPGIKWKKAEIVSHAGQDWIWLEMTSQAIDVDIYNIMLITPYNGKIVTFNFNSTKKEFPTYEAALRKSIESINIAD